MPKTLTVDRHVARALDAMLTRGPSGPRRVWPNGDVTFPVTDDVFSLIEETRLPGDSDSAVVRRLFDRADIHVPATKPN